MTHTQHETLPPPAVDRRPAAPAAVRPRRRHGWWAIPLAAVGLLTLAGVAVAAIIPAELVATKLNTRLDVEQGTPYAITPGSAEPVDDRIVFGELRDVASVYPPAGDIFFVTVTEPRQSVLSWLVGRELPMIQFLTHEDKYGIQTPQQRQTLSLASMRTSEQVAQYVALQRVGYEPELVPGDVLIEQMVCLEIDESGNDCAEWSPSDAVLDPGDKIVSVAGTPVANVDELVTLLGEYEPGDSVPMVIERPGKGELEVEVPLIASPDDPNRTIVGFYPFDTAQIELPFELEIDTGSIGGPSAGLAFTLTLIDELSPGELTGGRSVAVTGTMRLDGTVGPIGGLRQKASAVAQAGVDVFLVPEAQGEEDIAAAREAVDGDVEIIPVADLDAALAALGSIGGDPLEVAASGD